MFYPVIGDVSVLSDLKAAVNRLEREIGVIKLNLRDKQAHLATLRQDLSLQRAEVEDRQKWQRFFEYLHTPCWRYSVRGTDSFGLEPSAPWPRH